MEGTARDKTQEKADDTAQGTAELSVVQTHPIVSPLDSEHAVEQTVQYHVQSFCRTPTLGSPRGSPQVLSCSEPVNVEFSATPISDISIIPEKTAEMAPLPSNLPCNNLSRNPFIDFLSVFRKNLKSQAGNEKIKMIKVAKMAGKEWRAMKKNAQQISGKGSASSNVAEEPTATKNQDDNEAAVDESSDEE